MRKTLFFSFLFLFSFLSAAEKGMIIVTTEKIRSSSKELGNFISLKKLQGFDVLLGTEKDFGGADKGGVDKAVVIRNWLKSVHKGYGYLLLIGDPQPEYGNVPLLNAKVYRENTCESEGYDCSVFPTDAFYSDLTSEWDKDGDGLYGEWEDDFLKGGVEFDYELVVGRIPVYFNEVEPLDKILVSTIRYITMEKSVAESYRRKVLLPASITFYEDEVYSGSPDGDGAKIVSWLDENFFNSDHPIGKSYSLDALVEKEGIAPSTYDAPALSRESLIETWSKNYGITYWIAHGFPEGSFRTVWKEDSDGDGVPDKKEEYDSPVLIGNDDFVRIKSEPGFIYMGSCHNASPTTSRNMAYSALLHGVAVGVAANTKPVGGGDILVREFEPDDEFPQAFTYGTYFVTGVAEGKPAAEVLAEKKRDLGNIHEIHREWAFLYSIKLMLNYFGDPTLSIGTYGVVTESDENENEDAEIENSDDFGKDNPEENSVSSGCAVIGI